MTYEKLPKTKGSLDTTKNTYEITINPSDKYQFFGKPRRYELFLTMMDTFLKQSLDCWNIQYKLCVELSTPHINISMKTGNQSRLHFHGYVKFKTKRSKSCFHLHSVYKISRFGLLTFNNYRPDYWPEYMIKDYHLIKAINPSKNAHIFRHEMPIKQY